MKGVKRSPILWIFLILTGACSTPAVRTHEPSTTEVTKPQLADVLFQTPSFLFEQIQVMSEDHGTAVPAPRIRDSKSRNLLRDFSKEFPAHEWVFAQESSAGTIAILEYAVEGRGWELPIWIQLAPSAEWKLIRFRKPHFSNGVLKAALSEKGIELRLWVEPGTVPAKKITGKMISAETGETLPFSDWSYSFTQQRWTFQKRPSLR